MSSVNIKEVVLLETSATLTIGLFAAMRRQRCRDSQRIFTLA
jgi:hypothetical protein